jgi:RNA polymerase I-specific transcription initiation factor RRN5
MSDHGSDGGSVYDDANEELSRHEESASASETQDSDHDTRSTHSKSVGKNAKFSKSESGKRTEEGSTPTLRHVKPIKATYNDAYRELYNDIIEHVARPAIDKASALPATEIGAITWTPLEKEILIRKVPILGKDNIKGISESLGTKSLTEVRQYLMLLDEGKVEAYVTKALPKFSVSEAPAAFEVSKDSERLLEAYADGLARYQEKNDQKKEKKQHGDYWLLTEEIAQEIEHQVNAQQSSDDEDMEISDNHDTSRETSPGASEMEPESGPSTPQSNIHQDVQSGSGEANGQDSEPTEELMVPAAELLDLPAWLRLSQLFMYQSPSLGDDWTKYISTPDETPSMYHTAFQDLHNLTLSLTRRLVHAAIFQTMTRLRARDKDQRPSAKVTSVDVHAAADILDLKRDRRSFWGGVPRKHGLRVFERGTKFSKGESRSGAELTLEDAEEKLGVSTANRDPDGNVVSTVEDEYDDNVLDPDQYYATAELWTDESEGEYEAGIEIPDDEESISSEDNEDADHQMTEENDETKERLKARIRTREETARKFRRVHDSYLEALDQKSSREEESNLLDALGASPPDYIKQEQVEVPGEPYVSTRRSKAPTDWRDTIEYREPWERGHGDIQPEDFQKMHECGERGRKRRRLAYDYLEKEGFVDLTPRQPRSIVISKKAQTVSVDADKNSAAVQDKLPAPVQTLDEGVSRKRIPDNLPAKVQSRVKSRAPSTRASSYDSSRNEPAKATNQALVKALELQKRQNEDQAQSKARQEDIARKQRAIGG